MQSALESTTTLNSNKIPENKYVEWYNNIYLTEGIVGSSVIYTFETKDAEIEANGGHINLYTRTFKDGMTFKLNADGKSYMLINAEDVIGSIVISRVYTSGGGAGLVTDIAENAFKDNIKVTSVVIPGSMKSIGVNAFSGCSSLVEIELPNNLIIIESVAFSGCEKSSSIVIPYSVIEIGPGAFEDCIGLKYIYIPNSVEIVYMSILGQFENMSTIIYCEYEEDEILTSWDSDWNFTGLPVKWGYSIEEYLAETGQT